MKRCRTSPLPEAVECPSCYQMVQPWRAQFQIHPTHFGGPVCDMSREPITEDVIAATQRVLMARTVLDWAHTIRDEDPAVVHRWIAQTSRFELEQLLAIALLAIPAEVTMRKAFEWVEMLGA